jgi:hypothetical protein
LRNRLEGRNKIQIEMIENERQGKNQREGQNDSKIREI